MHFKWNKRYNNTLAIFLWQGIKMQFSHFPIIRQWELSVAMETKPRGRPPYF